MSHGFLYGRGRDCVRIIVGDKMKNIVVIEPLGVDESVVREQMEQFNDEYNLIYYSDRNEDPLVLAKRASEAHILVVSNIKIDEEILKLCPNLEMICVAFTGFDLIDIEYCKEHDIVVSNASGYATTGVVELVFGLIIDLYRRIKVGDKDVREGGTHNNIPGIEIEGKKFGVVGAGAIGKQVARVADAFNADVYVYNRSLVEMYNVTQVELEDIFKECDIISINLPLNDSTRGIINKELISLMKPNAVLINTARGPIVDNNALAEALIKGDIAGAGIDVFDMEPPIPSNYRLLQAPNTIFTPHVAYYTHEAMEKRFYIVIENIKAYRLGEPINKVY